MSRIPEWTGLEDQSWDTCILGGFFLPGAVYLSVEAGGGLEKQKQYGRAGAWTKDNGPDPAKVTIDIKLINGDDVEVWNQVWPNLQPPARGAARPAFDILHPACWIVNVKRIVIDKIKVGRFSAKGGGNVQLQCWEYVRPKPRRPIKNNLSINTRRTELGAASVLDVPAPSADPPTYG